MNCPKCKEERVSPTGLKTHPWCCRGCGHQWNNGIKPLYVIQPLDPVKDEPVIETHVKVARVSSKGRVTLELPDKPFSQKELAAFNNIANYKEVYSDLQRMLASGMVKVHGFREVSEGTRGKAAKLFVKVKK